MPGVLAWAHDAHVVPETSARLRVLRLHLGLSQDALCRASGLDRAIVAQIERGRNAMSGYSTRVALARGFDLPLEAFAAYLDGQISLRGLLAVRGRRGEADWWRPIVEAAEAG